MSPPTRPDLGDSTKPNQVGLGFRVIDFWTEFRVWGLGLENFGHNLGFRVIDFWIQFRYYYRHGFQDGLVFLRRMNHIGSNGHGTSGLPWSTHYAS